MLAKIEPDIPIYHTRAMRRAFYTDINKLIVGPIPAHVLRHLYRTLTDDSSSEIDGKEIDARVRLATEIEESNLILDLRHLNKGRPET